MKYVKSQNVRKIYMVGLCLTCDFSAYQYFMQNLFQFFYIYAFYVFVFEFKFLTASRHICTWFTFVNFLLLASNN